MSKSKMLTLLAKVAVGIRWHTQLRLSEKDLIETLWTKVCAGYKETRKSSQLTSLQQK